MEPGAPKRQLSRASNGPALIFLSSILTNPQAAMKKHADSIDAAILDRIRSGAKDYVWTPTETRSQERWRA